MIISQYRMVTVNLDLTIGSEIKKTRPCIIISPMEMNDNLRTVIIAPLTSQPKKYPTRVLIKTGRTKSMCALDQIRTIDKQRIIKTGKPITPLEIGDLKRVLSEMLIE